MVAGNDVIVYIALIIHHVSHAILTSLFYFFLSICMDLWPFSVTKLIPGWLPTYDPQGDLVAIFLVIIKIKYFHPHVAMHIYTYM